MSTTNSDSTRRCANRPIGEIASELTRDLSLLVRQELELAKAEMAEKGKDRRSRAGNARRRRPASGLMAAGALTACAVLVLAIFLPAWLAALVVGVVLAGSGVSARQAWQGAGREGRRSDS